MPYRLPLRSLACWVLALATIVPAALAQSSHVKNVWNYDGGIFLETDGSIPGSACFRVKGRVSSPDFFINLKREDTTSGTLFRRGNDVLTVFPKELDLTVTIIDMPCDPFRKQTEARIHLTDAMVRNLSLSFYWKHELEMRPVRGIVVQSFEAGSAPSYFGQETQRYACLLKFAVPSDGVPLTDSLVLILRTPDRRIVARTAARL